MPNEIYQALIGLRVTIEFDDKDKERREVDGKIAAVYLVGRELYVAVKPEEGYLITGPVCNCYVGEGPDTIIGDPTLDWNDGVGE
jgi:hypothetical protein